MLNPLRTPIAILPVVRAGAISLGLLLGLQTLNPLTLQAQYPNHYKREVKGPVDMTINNLKNIAAANTYSGKERGRYDAAMTHLSQFAEKMQRGKFDRGKLDQGIGDVQNVLNKNPMDGRARDILNNNVMELRRLRDTYPR